MFQYAGRVVCKVDLLTSETSLTFELSLNSDKTHQVLLKVGRHSKLCSLGEKM